MEQIEDGESCLSKVAVEPI
ncbi:hypothetical protein F383_15275 [Gossypium arboreum]|uniref:Uncharacterized protein n=1 Tax=Gossypium arboreum TaxID=29729 RepID=A0A0B0PQB7_GOSAR|nr:hypothetical protein F383_15275 [Gossypium arboreum]